MKNYASAVLFSGVALTLGVVAADSFAAQRPERQQSLSRGQMDTLLKSEVKATCEAKVPAVPTAGVKTFPVERVAKTLHGTWRGRVVGDYPKQYMAKDGTLNVDYYWIIDTTKSEALILEQLTEKRTAPEPKKGAPVWSFVTCGREGYTPRHPPQIHEFHKVSDRVDDAPRMLAASTGLKIAAATTGGEVSLASAWRSLVEQKYFDTMKFGAFAGGLFKPFELANFVDPAGTPVISLNYSAEYRGAGETAARFESGVAIHGREGAQFVGVTADNGDFLVASELNGTVWAKEATVFGNIDMRIDKVVIGPLVN